MKKPEIGQVLATAGGQQFRVVDVYSLAEPDEPDSVDDFGVELEGWTGLHAVPGGFVMDLLHFEFEEWCQANGVSY